MKGWYDEMSEVNALQVQAVGKEMGRIMAERWALPLDNTKPEWEAQGIGNTVLVTFEVQHQISLSEFNEIQAQAQQKVMELLNESRG